LKSVGLSFGRVIELNAGQYFEADYDGFHSVTRQNTKLVVLLEVNHFLGLFTASNSL
jgi:hypothetical protein